jgi:hypothetical protein
MRLLQDTKSEMQKFHRRYELRASKCLASGNGGNERDAVAVADRAGFAAEEANVLFVEVDVQELADLALLIAKVTRDFGEVRCKLVEDGGESAGRTLQGRRSRRETAKGRGDINDDGHVRFSFRKMEK